ncbi:HpcH/HpaI aldolase/citrate lyase family protein [Sphingomonas jeddahensis]|uniref:(3S)-malyl-CoA thioesterase n=1 Tax=Sphingomonas jeddahensis TaxID=1915074 RepID=A0A1V2EW73_9SPHN|nr:CoA ester lyase [Sphingomonas jeddahensis]ONF96850.1 (3S)-malyl-CoA thioesterase [Sphingomonas jeddahensis]
MNAATQRSSARIADARHFLFVPGNRPERFDKAVASGADVVILDLEDAVPAAEKELARDAVRRWLDAGGEAVVRINAADTPYAREDIALARHPNVISIMLPKAAADSALAQVAALSPVIALIETATGVASVEAVASCPGVVRLALGTIDLALDLDILSDDDRLFDPIRLRFTVASRAAGIAAPVEGVTANFRDRGANEAAMRHARALGFRAKMCIHPQQLATVSAALRPSESEIEQARRIVAADNASGGTAVALDGRMIDRPVVARAHRLLADAAA